MHAGLPVVGTDLGAVPDFVHDGVTGFLVPTDDVATLTNRLSRLVDDPALARSLGAKARTLAEQRYQWSVVMERIRDEIDTALTTVANRTARSRRTPLRVAAMVVGMRIDGGAEALVRTLLYEVRDSPCEITVFTLRKVDPAARQAMERLGARIVELPGRKLISPRRFARMLWSLRRGGYDVIHTHLTGANLLGLVCGAILRKPVVVTLHSTRSSADEHWYHGRLERTLIRRFASRVIAVGGETASARAAVLGDDVAIHVLPNAVAPSSPPSGDDERALRAEMASDPDAPLFIKVGRLETAKAHEVLIRAFHVVRRDLPAAELVLVGDGRLRQELVELAASLGLADAVHFLGRRPDARRLVAAADVFVMSSVWEGLPMALLEAMEAGTPVVATDVGDIGDVLSGTPSRVVPPSDVDALATAMLATYHDLIAGRDLSSAGRAVVADRYSSTAWADRVIEHYHAAMTA
jgi:glycosyltransferase involved in cell wall biosynthesis